MRTVRGIPVADSPDVPDDETAVAVVGMSGAFPGASDPAALWRMLLAGDEGITRFTDDELAKTGVDATLLADPAYVRANPVLEGIEEFDAEFFGLAPREAQITDPQQRLMLEHSWRALEDAGLDPARFPGAIGVLAGCAISGYLLNNLLPRKELFDIVGEIGIGLGNDKDSLATRVGYTLDLTGPCHSVQSYCSTSLVAVCLGCSTLASGEADVVLAGGVSVNVPHRVGYLYQKAGMASPDGHCRAFDADSEGTPVGSGIGVVALRRLTDALADRDRVYAVIRGWAITNDGAAKVGFTAPGVRGQAAAIAEAIAAAGWDPEDIDYVEAHGTGTPLGDAAEIAALQQVFTDPRRRPVLGSVKSNVGHLDRAAGVTGLIKTVMALRSRTIPATLNVVRPNPQFEAAGGGFPIATARAEWTARDRPRRAGVSAFGIGGTNAHVAVEEFTGTAHVVARLSAREHQVLVWSARTPDAADELGAQLADAIAGGADIADMAYTLQVGRHAFAHRRAVVVADAEDAARTVRSHDVVRRSQLDGPVPRLALLLGDSGADAAFVAALRAAEPEFASAFNECARMAGESRTSAQFEKFAFSYAVGRLLLSWVDKPGMLAGHGVGELAAACLAGRLELEDAVAAVIDPVAGEKTLPSGLLERPDLNGVVVLAAGPVDDAVAGAAKEIVPVVPAPGQLRSAGECLADVVARLWLHCVPLDWTAYTDGRPAAKTSLPTYPFQRRRYWVDPPARTENVTPQRATAEEVPTHYLPVWEPVGAVAASASIERCQVVADRDGLGDAVAQRLTTRGVSVSLECPEDPTDFTRLVGDLAEPPDAVVHLLATGEPDAGEVYRRGIDSVIAVAQALAECSFAGRLVVATTRANAVRPGEAPVPARATIRGACLTIGQEYPDFDVRTVDIEPTDADAVVAELLRDAPTVVSNTGDVPTGAVAYRDGKRWIEILRPAGETGAATAPVVLGERASVLITGGLGSVGLVVAEHLARRLHARLVLTSRSGLPPREQWAGVTEERVRKRIEAVRRIEDAGGEVLVAAADVADEKQMEAVAAQAVTRFGGLDAVIHAAGLTDLADFRSVAETKPDERRRMFRAKADGAELLGNALSAAKPRLVILFSSISTVLGGIAFASYAAANCYLDALAEARTALSDGGTRWLAIDWDTWQPTAEGLANGLGASMAEYSMTVEQGLAVLDRVLDRPATRSVVSSGALGERMRRWVTGGRRDKPAVHSDQPRQPRPELAQPYVPPATPAERSLVSLWQDALGVDRVGVLDPFFDLGGTSLMGIQLVSRINRTFGTSVSAVALFAAPTVRALADTLDRATKDPQKATGTAHKTEDAAEPVVAKEIRPSAEVTVRPEQPVRDDRDHVAIIGMAGRFPGADSVDALWDNLVRGVESISFFTDEELRVSGVDPETSSRPDYVPARPVLDDIRGFDADFFGYSPREAEFTDPQHRIFLEVCWEALETAGYGDAARRGTVAVYGGCNISTYFLGLYDRVKHSDELDDYQAVIGNDKDSLATAVSYKFGLTGPSMSVQTFCSTSLVAVHLARRSLLAGECDIALAGGVSVRVPDRVGHRHVPGGMESPDGHVRTFDADAHGSMFGDGAAVVVLKRLSAAVANGDTVLAVIRGSAINNDGSLKVGYTAPSVVGQADVIRAALAESGVDPADVSYVEAHGTGTELGDPIEVAALTEAFGDTGRRGYCRIGSVKPNVGHLDRAAGATGVIKVVQMLRHGMIPPTLHFKQPNPRIDFENSPFYVNAELAQWRTRDGVPRIAGVSSLGMGGTNVHVVLEEAQHHVTGHRDEAPRPDDRRYHVIPVSARGAVAADEAAARLGAHLSAHPDLRVADVAHTLQTGRAVFEHRRAAVATSLADVVAVCTGQEPGRLLSRSDATRGRQVALLFAGVGEQYPGMLAELSRREPVIAGVLDECAEILRGTPAARAVELLGPVGRMQRVGPDFGGLAAGLGRAETPSGGAAGPLADTAIAQPAVFVALYAVARLLAAWGVEPVLMLGYSVGEYVAACLSGVMSLPDALRLVVRRAELIATLPAGTMIAVGLPADRIAEVLGQPEESGLDVAVVSGPGMTTLAGPVEAARNAVKRLREADIAHRELDATHAFHSRMLEPVRTELTAWVRDNVTLHEPRVRYLSNVTGKEITAAEATDPGYWAEHMCGTVRFGDAVERLLAEPDLSIVEIGPGQSLGSMVRSHPRCAPDRWPLVTSTLPSAADPLPDDEVLHRALAQLWLCGVDLDWAAYHRGRDARRVPLPSYPFQRKEYWIEAGTSNGPPAARDESCGDDPTARLSALSMLDETQWLHAPVWHQTPPPPAVSLADRRWLVFAHPPGLCPGSDLVVTALRDSGVTVVEVRPGNAFTPVDGGYTVRPGERGDIAELLATEANSSTMPERFVHLWSLDGTDGNAEWNGDDRLGLETLVALAQAAGDMGLDSWAVDVLTAGAHSVIGTERLRPSAALLAGPCRVVPLEDTGATWRLIDLSPGYDLDTQRCAVLVAELGGRGKDPVVAMRAGRRWVPRYDQMSPIQMTTVEHDAPAIRDGGVYLVTGGLGGVGLAIAAGLAKHRGARLVLFGRTGLPPRETWESVQANPAASEEVLRRVRGVRAIEELGSPVEVVAGDVTDPADVERAVACAESRFGRLDGVLHAAGLPGMGLLQLRAPVDGARVRAPKVRGTLVLDRVLRKRGVELLVLFSSITSLTGGGPGQLDYCSANAFLDCFAQARANHPVPDAPRVVAVNWGEWQWNAWRGGIEGYRPELREFFTGHRGRFGIDDEAGFRSLSRVLDAGGTQTIVSTQDFSAIMELSGDFTVDLVTGPGKDEPASGTRHARPDIGTQYVEPATPTERAIAAVWADRLGLTEVGAADNFFELGGNSLLGVDIIARIRRELGIVRLQPYVLYEAPTVAALAALLDGAEVASTEHQDRSERRLAGLRRGRSRR